MDMLTVFLSSGLVSAGVSAWILGRYKLRAKHEEYVNDYYKIVLERRVAAYEEVERLIVSIKIAVTDDDNRPYHFIFANKESLNDVYKMLYDPMKNALWLSDEMFELVRGLNMLVYSGTEGVASPVEFGKIHYAKIAAMRVALEKTHAMDMMGLHDVPGFLRAKKPTDGYEEISNPN